MKVMVVKSPAITVLESVFFSQHICNLSLHSSCSYLECIYIYNYLFLLNGSIQHQTTTFCISFYRLYLQWYNYSWLLWVLFLYLFPSHHCWFMHVFNGIMSLMQRVYHQALVHPASLQLLIERLNMYVFLLHVLPVIYMTCVPQQASYAGMTAYYLLFMCFLKSRNWVFFRTNCSTYDFQVYKKVSRDIYIFHRSGLAKMIEAVTWLLYGP